MIAKLGSWFGTPVRATGMVIEADVEIPTWFGVGGRASRLARASSLDDLRRCLELDPALRVLGDGANLLVDDAGVPELVVTMRQGTLTDLDLDRSSGIVRVGAGHDLAKLVHATVREGLAGLEGLAGIPATVGGATVMNAGGAFCQWSESVRVVECLDRTGRDVRIERPAAGFGYRASGLRDLLVTGVELKLRHDDPERLRRRLKEVMAFKKKSQPLAERSAGCVFKNPTLRDYIDNVGVPGARVSAGLLIDRAGGKGMRSGGAEVSTQHANFIVAKRGCTARDVMTLIDQVRAKVLDTFGVALETEVVVWRARA